MVHLVALLEATQDRHRVFLAGLVHLHLLETPLQRRILLDVLAVLVQGGGTDTVQLTPGQRRLEHVAGVHGALGLARTDHGVQFVDEQDDPPFFLGQLVEHRLQALLEFTAKLGASQQRAHVQRQHALVLEPLGHLAVDDAAGQPLDDGGLADAGLADQHRVVLGAPLQHLDGATDLVVTPDHRIQLAVGGPLGQIQGVLLQRLAAVLGVGVIHLLATAHAIDGALQRLARKASLGQRLGHGMLHGDCRQQYQFTGDVLIATLLGLGIGEVEQLDQIPGRLHFAVELGDLGQIVDLARQGVTQPTGVAPRLLYQRLDAGVAVVEQRQQQVRRFHLIVPAPHGEGLGVGDSLLQLGGKLVKTHRYLLSGWRCVRTHRLTLSM